MSQAWLPSEGLLREHHDYGTWCTDAPPIYHVASMVTALASVCADQARLVVDNHIYPLHTWAMMVGRSTADRKTTATRLAMARVEAVVPGRVQRIYGSPEGILQGMQQTPCICLYVPEGGAFFAQREASYWKHARDIFMDLYDYTKKFERRLVRDTLRIDHPRISILSACAFPLLERYTRDSDWLGGFLARFMMVGGTPLEFKRRPRSDEAIERRLEELVSNVFHKNWGTLGMTSGARRILDDFAEEIHTELDAYDPGLHPSLNRLPETANRLAALYEIAQWAGSPPADNQITLVRTEAALGAAALCRASRDHALSQLGELTAGVGPRRDLARVEATIRRAGLGGMPRTVLMRAIRLRARDLDQLLGTLHEAELIRLEISTPHGKKGPPRQRYFHVEAEHDAERLARAAAEVPTVPAAWVDFSGDRPHQLDALPVASAPPPWATVVDDDDDPDQWN